MLIEIFQSKIHRARVTEADLNYRGSITIDMDLLDATGMIPNQRVQVVNINNGERLETYAIAGQRGSGTICLNGPAARKVQPGDLVVIMSYARMTPEEARTFTPTVVHVDEDNRITNQL